MMTENEKQLAAQLAQQNLYLISAKVAPDSPSSSFINLGNKIKLPKQILDKINFSEYDISFTQNNNIIIKGKEKTLKL